MRLLPVLIVSLFVNIAVAQIPAPDQPPAPPAKPAADNGKQAPTAVTHPNNPELWNVEAMMNEALLQISRRYNLNPAQEQYTKLLLEDRVKKFLEKYETDARELLKESIDLKMGKKPATIETWKKWAERAAPIYEAATKAILDGNEEWHAILSPEQIKIHDMDVSLMKTNFQQIQVTLGQWKAGQGIPGISSPVSNPGAAVTHGVVSNDPTVVVRLLLEDQWLDYVNFFISAYKLDEKQKVSALDRIHKEYRADATKYRDKHKTEFATVDEATKGSTPKAVHERISKKMELEKPIRKMFVDMNKRLHDLLTRDQVSGIDPQKKQQLEHFYAVLAQDSRPNTKVNPSVRPDKPAGADHSTTPTKPTVPANKPVMVGASTATQPASATKPPAPTPPPAPNKPVSDEASKPAHP